MGVTEQERLHAQIVDLRAELSRLQEEAGRLSAVVTPLREEVAGLNDQRAQVAALRAEVGRLQYQRDELRSQTGDLQKLVAELPGLRAEYAEVSRQLIETRETAILQEVGVEWRQSEQTRRQQTALAS